MKKCIVFCFVLLSLNAFAQGQIKFGVTGGLLNTDANVDLSLGNIINLASIDAVNETGFYILWKLLNSPSQHQFYQN